MDYRFYAKDLLKRKNQLISAHKSIKAELESLEEEKYSCKISDSSATPIQGGGNRYEDRIVTLISRINDCQMRLKVVTRELEMIENGMAGLSDYESELLEGLYVTGNTQVAESLMSRFCRERSGLYRDASRALDRFTRSIYGVLQL